MDVRWIQNALMTKLAMKESVPTHVSSIIHVPQMLNVTLPNTEPIVDAPPACKVMATTSA